MDKMVALPPFTPGNEDSIQEYRSRMSYLRQASRERPLAAGTTFVLALPQPPTRSVQLVERARHVPSLPYGKPVVYTLTRPLKEGFDLRSQVWVATALDEDSQVTVEVVFKFVIPSLLHYPDPGLTEGLKRCGAYRSPAQLVEREVASYMALADLQGGTLPYFLGEHQVLVPWMEEGSILALEYIKAPTLKSIQEDVDSAVGTAIYRDYAQYFALFESALRTLDFAHQRDTFHCDVREPNIFVPEGNNIAVLVDWSSENVSSKELYVGNDVVDLAVAFILCETHQAQLRESIRIHYPDISRRVSPYLGTAM
ncbi:serine/threonine kinase, SPS1 [Schizophyllum commune]